MNYKEVLEFMFNSLPMYQRIGQAAYKADLNNTHALDSYFNYPHKEFKTIHVAGTNGKGSVSHSLASVLQQSGYKTGLYTSPHLVDFRERIRVDGFMITEEFVCDFINNNKNIIEEIQPSFFEMSVAMAFEYFRYSKVDIAVIEVGMGGRLDSTNIITPELSVITNIGFDHTQFLGDSLQKIAIEKAGIIKNGIPVVIGETHNETKRIFEDIAYRSGSPIIFADSEYNTKLMDQYKGLYEISHNHNIFELSFDLSGKYQEKNLPTILTSIDVLRSKKFHISNYDLKKGLCEIKRNTGLRGRWETLNQSPLIICDTGHNKEGLTYVINQITSQDYNKLYIILGFVNDKNVSAVLDMFPKEAEYYFTQANIPRAMPTEKLMEEAGKHGLSGNSYPDVKTAYEEALKKAGNNDMIFIGGSTFVVGDLLGEL